MSTMPDRVRRAPFEQYSMPHLTTAKRGEVSQTAWVGIFNLMLSRWHTGGPWEGLPVAKDRQAREQGNEPS
jgi:hypothetical protein